MLKFKFFKRLRVIFLSKKGDFCELVKNKTGVRYSFPALPIGNRKLDLC